MALEFCRILTGVGVGSGGIGTQTEVDGGPVGIQQLAVDQAAGGIGGVTGRSMAEMRTVL